MYVYMYVCMYVCMCVCVCMYVCMYVCMCGVCIYIYIPILPTASQHKRYVQQLYFTYELIAFSEIFLFLLFNRYPANVANMVSS